MDVKDSILDLIGNTPLLQISRMADVPPLLLAKVENASTMRVISGSSASGSSTRESSSCCK